MTPQPRYDLVGAERRGTGKTWEDGQILEFQRQLLKVCSDPKKWAEHFAETLKLQKPWP